MARQRPSPDYVFADEQFVVELPSVVCGNWLTNCTAWPTIASSLMGTGNYRNLSAEWRRIATLPFDRYRVMIRGVSNIDRRSEGDIVSDVLIAFQNGGWDPGYGRITVYRAPETIQSTQATSTATLQPTPAPKNQNQLNSIWQVTAPSGTTIGLSGAALAAGVILGVLILTRR